MMCEGNSDDAVSCLVEQVAALAVAAEDPDSDHA